MDTFTEFKQQLQYCCNEDVSININNLEKLANSKKINIIIGNIVYGYSFYDLNESEQYVMEKGKLISLRKIKNDGVTVLSSFSLLASYDCNTDEINIIAVTVNSGSLYTNAFNKATMEREKNRGKITIKRKFDYEE